MQYLLRYLSHQQIDQAFPLVQLAEPGLSLERWRAFAGCMARDDPAGFAAGTPPERCVVTAQDTAKYIHGLFCYRLREDLLADRTLKVSHFCVCSLVDPAGVTEALLRAIDILAGRLGCPQVCAELSDGASALMGRRALIQHFETFGHRAGGLFFRRRQAGQEAASS
ncbi:MAG: hypothetical protein IRY94_05850 [Rhodospirillaceae bacterium]|nr:hypothetical protein [Rhodospirillaceae bacterium]